MLCALKEILWRKKNKAKQNKTKENGISLMNQTLGKWKRQSFLCNVCNMNNLMLFLLVLASPNDAETFDSCCCLNHVHLEAEMFTSDSVKPGVKKTQKQTKQKHSSSKCTQCLACFICLKELQEALRGAFVAPLCFQHPVQAQLIVHPEHILTHTSSLCQTLRITDASSIKSQADGTFLTERERKDLK